MRQNLATQFLIGILCLSPNFGCGVHESRNFAHESETSFDKPDLQTPESAFALEIQSGDVGAVENRLATGTDVNLRLARGRTPIMVAALWGKVEIAKLFLQRGANLTLLDIDGKDVWSYAEGNAEFIRLLPSRVSLEKRLELFEFVKTGNYRALKSELDGGVDPNLRDESGRTLLIAGVYARQRAVVSTLARYPGVDLNLRDSDGNSARSVAEALGEQQILRELIARGAL